MGPTNQWKAQDDSSVRELKVNQKAISVCSAKGMVSPEVALRLFTQNISISKE